ncbi:MAG: phosphoadenosine phosphosulfate reductase family protein [Promethearchaeota archaeon]
MPKTVYLGPLMLNWCIHCNIPILEAQNCSLCGNPTIKCKITPPGDTRPAFKHDIELIRRTIDLQYGVEMGRKVVPDKKVVVLNKAPALDRRNEIILDGVIIGALYFDIQHQQWKFLPRVEGARRLWLAGCNKWVKIYEGAVDPLLKGASLLAPGVKDCDPTIQPEDNVIIVTPLDDVLGVGVAKFSGETILTTKRGMVVKMKHRKPPTFPAILPDGQTWDMVVQANMQILNSRTEEAIQFMKSIAESYRKPKAVAYSGGKDSLCLLLLAKEALGENFDVFFADTGIEFPETIDNVFTTMKNLGIENRFIYKKAEANWEIMCNKFGPPARDFRWCCKLFKLSPTAQIIREHYPQGVITFLGVRRYESQPRAKENRIWKNPFVPGQIGASPIKNWTALHVWLYLLMKDAVVNPLYYKGFERIGCIYCPAMKLSELHDIKETHEHLYRFWMEFLNKWAESHGYPEEWATFGFWRWKKLAKGQIQVAEQLGLQANELESHIDIQPTHYGITEKTYTKDRDFYTLEGQFPFVIDIERAGNILHILGHSFTNDSLDQVNMQIDESSVTIFADGTFKVSMSDWKTGKRLIKNITKVLLRVQKCVGCGFCEIFCPQGAITLVQDEYPLIDEKKCINCSQCLNTCPSLLLFSEKPLIKQDCIEKVSSPS